MGVVAHDLCQAIGAELKQIDELAPLVIDAYRQRRVDRLQSTLAEFAVTLNPADALPGAMAHLLLCWGALLAIIVVLMFAIAYFLRRKDVRS